MRRVKRSGLVAVVVAAAMVAAAGPATAEPDATTHVDSVSVTPSAGSLAVSGHASFVDGPPQVAEDPTGDVALHNYLLQVGRPSGVSLGDDLVTAQIASPDPLKPNLTFTLGVANQPPMLNGTPEGLNYLWYVYVEGEPFVLWAARSSQFAAGGPSADPVFELRKCEPAPVGGSPICHTVATLEGVMADGVVQWQVPMSRIGAKPFSVVGSQRIHTVWGVSGPDAVSRQLAYYYWSGDQMRGPGYRVPAPVVEVGIAPAGTPAESVELTDTAEVDDAGSFSAMIPAPAEPGEYVVVARACVGWAWMGNCGLATTTVTI